MKGTLKNARRSYENAELADLEAFALACGITTKTALVFRDDLTLVALDLPRLGKTRR